MIIRIIYLITTISFSKSSQEVEHNSPSFEAGLRAGDLISHINDESVQSLLHTQVVHLLSSGNIVNIRAMPLDKTSIREGSRRKGNPGKMVRRSQKKKQSKDKVVDKKKSRALFRRLSNKKSEPLFPYVHIPHHHAPGRQQFTPLNRSSSSGDGTPVHAHHHHHHSKLGRSPPISVPWSPDSSQAGSSNSSSPSSSAPNSPATQAHFGRPSSLHVAKHKKTASLKSPHRRKSIHNFPLSPLARTPSPSAVTTSPARSPSPLALPQGHLIGSSNLPQQTIPSHHTGASPHANSASPHALAQAHHHHHLHHPHPHPHPLHHPSPAPACKKSLHSASALKSVVGAYASPPPPAPPPSASSSSCSSPQIPPSRPKSCEPGSPMLRRTSSPERLHPSSAHQRSMDKPPPHRKVSLQERITSSPPEPP